MTSAGRNECHQLTMSMIEARDRFIRQAEDLISRRTTTAKAAGRALADFESALGQWAIPDLFDLIDATEVECQ